MNTTAILTQAEQFAQTSKLPTHESQSVLQWGESGQADALRPVHLSFPLINDYPLYRRSCPSPRYSCGEQNSSNSESDRKNEFALMVAISSLFTIAFAYFLGKGLGQIYQTNRKINALDAAEISDPKVKRVVQIHKEMLETINSSTKTGLALKGALLASLTTAMAGGAAIAPIPLVAGCAGSVAAAAALCVRKGYNDHDFTLAERADDLLEAVNLAKV